jgi:nitrate/nitrite transport system permease protein
VIAESAVASAALEPAVETPRRRPIDTNLAAACWFAVSFLIFIGAWAWCSHSGFASKLLPTPEAQFANLVDTLRDPFYIHGESDRGIGFHILSSLGRVLVGFAIAAVIAIPVGIALGLSPVASKAADLYIQVLRPVSPLAWLPLGLALFKSSQVTALFVIAISSVWPILLNTLFGVRAIDPTYRDVARTLGTSRWQTLWRVILPATAPSIVNGLRIGIGIAWLVIIAAEMLIGGSGIGYFVWNEWNNLSVPSIITAIIVIGFVGLGFDRLFALLHRAVNYR